MTLFGEHARLSFFGQMLEDEFWDEHFMFLGRGVEGLNVTWDPGEYRNKTHLWQV